MDLEKAKQFAAKRTKLEKEIDANNPKPPADTADLTPQERFQRLVSRVRQTAHNEYPEEYGGRNYVRKRLLPELGRVTVNVRERLPDTVYGKRPVDVTATWALDPEGKKIFAHEGVTTANFEGPNFKGQVTEEALRQLTLLEQSLEATYSDLTEQ